MAGAITPASAQPSAAPASDPSLAVPALLLAGVPVDITAAPVSGSGSWQLNVAGTAYTATPSGGSLTFSGVTVPGGAAAFELRAPDGAVAARDTRSAVPGWLSLLPAILAIGAVILLRQVVPALALGIWAGASLFYGLSFESLVTGFFAAMPDVVVVALTDPDRLSILLFTIMIGGLIGVLNQNGGMAGIAAGMARLARTPRRGQAATSALGLAIFFDDYANVLVVGNTMRPITDRLRISREKLAYIVDSTAAPVSALAIITTWIGFMVSTIDDGLDALGAEDLNAYGLFLDSLAFAFYPILAIVLVWIVTLTGRDIGPMLASERAARAKAPRTGGTFDPASLDSSDTDPAGWDGAPAPNPWFAVIPLGVLIFGTLGGVIATGMADSPPGASVRDIFGAGNSFKAMLWASLGGAIVAIALSVAGGRLTLGHAMDSWLAGTRSMMLPAVVLTLAWSLSTVNGMIQTDTYLVTLLGDSLPLWAMPTLVFLLAAAMAFTTGTSWGVMGIMMPLVVPLAWAVTGAGGGLSGIEAAVFSATIGAVMGGAVWGDHCSPISDTTVMSSLAAGCDHADHVRTQLPYALLAGMAAILFGLLPVGFGLAWWLALPLALAAMAAVFRILSRPVMESGR